MAQDWPFALHSSHSHTAGITLVTDGNPPATTITMAEMAEMVPMVPMGLRYGVHASTATSQREETRY